MMSQRGMLKVPTPLSSARAHQPEDARREAPYRGVTGGFVLGRSPRLRTADMAFEICGDELVLVLDPGQRISSFYFGCPRGKRFWLRPAPCSRRRRRVTGAQSDGRGPHAAADGRLSRVPAASLQSITDCFPTGEPWKVLRGLSCPALYCGAVLCLGTQRYFDDVTGAPVKDFAASPPPDFFKCAVCFVGASQTASHPRRCTGFCGPRSWS